MVIAMKEEKTISLLQEKLIKGMKENKTIKLDFDGMLNIEEDFLKELFSTYPKSSDFLKKVRILNANAVIVHSLKMVINSVDRKKK